MKEFDTYLFDFDGTLVDSHDSLVEIFLNAYRIVGIEVDPSYVLRLMRISLTQGYEELKAPKDKFKEFGDEIIRLLDDKDIIKLTKTYQEVNEALFELKKKNKTLGIVTSNNRKHVNDVLNFVGIDKNLFSTIIGNFETKRHKPDPDPILKALEELNISKENVCYVGDGLDDMKCASSAGVFPVLVDRLNEYDSMDYFVIKDLLELVK